VSEIITDERITDPELLDMVGQLLILLDKADGAGVNRRKLLDLREQIRRKLDG
jgi:hypothetical protein